MIVGHGSLSKLINDRERFIFFAAGVSNSLEVTDCDVMRECGILRSACNISTLMEYMFVYFSSISVFTNKTRYQEHKMKMEEIIRLEANHFTILRIGNIWECTNPHTFINSYKTKPYEPRDEYKYMISKEQLNFITDNLPRTGKHEISIFGEMRKIKDCL